MCPSRETCSTKPDTLWTPQILSSPPSFLKLLLDLHHKDKSTDQTLDNLNFVCKYDTYDVDTTASILPPHDFPEGKEVNPTIWTAIQDNRHFKEPKKTKPRVKKTKKAATPSVTAPTSQEAIVANNAMDVDQREKSSATPMPMTPQPVVRPVDNLGRAANALPPIPPQLAWAPSQAAPKVLTQLAASAPCPSGPQRPDGNTPIPQIEELTEKAQVALQMLNSNYNAYLVATEQRQVAISAMHLWQCISAQEALCSLLGDSKTIVYSQGWSAKDAVRAPGQHRGVPPAKPQSAVQLKPAPASLSREEKRAKMEREQQRKRERTFLLKPRSRANDGYCRVPPALFGPYGQKGLIPIESIQLPPEVTNLKFSSPDPNSISPPSSTNEKNLLQEI
ncbi:hypothetical protein PCANC_01755 [Puccinia coronata f. sp. avenae]|uniref:Uncharacterized protein n=1 Tax=Puccinia coronata f. sp. avenae TaxID=200324 RepID=A0A2N5W550_9BASI|nr:hypothetical protein PCANC_01755 [Puccinia coronata f. sp. avenae]